MTRKRLGKSLKIPNLFLATHPPIEHFRAKSYFVGYHRSALGDALLMGVWGHEIFDNDTACDWQEQLLRGDDLSLIEGTLSQITETGEEGIEADQASEALAACDVLARLRGRPGLQEASLDQLDKWVKEHQHLASDHLIPLAQQALRRITVEDCELQQLWAESDRYAQWLATIDDVRRRLA